MPRGQRKSLLEKLQIELTETKDSIRQYENCLETLRRREANLEEQVKLEECKEVATILDETGLTIDELKSFLKDKLIENMNDQEQSA